MKRYFAVLLLLIYVFQAYSWGQTGHRVVGLIAEKHLTKRAKKNLMKVLNNETLAEVSNYMDFIKSDNSYRHMSPWHYATIPDGQSYEEAGTPEQGDVIQTIQRLTAELKTKKFADEDELFALKCLVHLVGDIHQPLHVGNGQDKGGNDVKLEYFRKSSNLHRVWDSGMIDATQYSYTEYAEWINHATQKQINQWQKDGILVWADESVSYRDKIYDLSESMKLSYRYNYEHIATVNQRLLQAGIRLAGILNEIYG